MKKKEREELQRRWEDACRTRMPCAEIPYDGELDIVYFHLDTKEPRVRFCFGGCTNSGFFELGHIDYDDSKTLDENLRDCYICAVEYVTKGGGK